MKFSKRMENLPPYLFAELDRMKNEKIAQGIDVISLGVGDPDMPTAPMVIEAMQKAVADARHHQYPPYDGTPEFKQAVADFYKDRYGVNLKPDGEVLALMGSKEGIAHISMAVLDPGDILLAPDPGYPVYATGAGFAGADVHLMPLLKENDFLPDFGRIPSDILKRARMMFLNYPNNPTSATAPPDFYRTAVKFAKQHDILICSDNSYGDIYFGNTPPPSILSIEGARDVAVEFYSLSKPFNMTGWRIAVMVGNEKAVNALATFKKNIDSGTFTAIQTAGALALKNGQGFAEKMRNIYRKRIEKMVTGLKKAGFDAHEPTATFYLWLPTPDGMKSLDFTKELLEKTGVLVSPGVGFGRYGEGFFRISLTLPDERVDEAVARLSGYESRA